MAIHNIDTNDDVDSEPLRDNFNISLRTTLTNSINSDIDGINDVPVDNLGYQTLTTTEVDQTNTTAYCRGGTSDGGIGRGIICFLPYIDRCDDSSIDAAYWTETGGNGGGGTEGTDGIYGSFSVSNSNDGSATVTSDGSTGIDLKKDMELCFTVSLRATCSNSVNCYARVSIVGSSSGEVTLGSISQSESGTTYGQDFFHLVIDESEEEAKVYTNGSATSSTKNLSSLTGTSWYLRLYTYSSGVNQGGESASGIARMYGVSGLDDGDATSELVYQSNGLSLDYESTSVYSFVRLQVATEVDLAYSADNGSNFSTDITGKETIQGGLTAGSSGVIRIKATPSSDITTNYPDRSSPEVYAWGTLFD